MAEYNQDRFELEIQAKEVQPPERIAMAKVFVSISLYIFFFVCIMCTHNVEWFQSKKEFSLARFGFMNQNSLYV